MYRGFTELPKRQISMVAERFVDRRRNFVKNFGGFKSENADMSNDKSCDNHDRRKLKGFCVLFFSAE